MKRITFQYVPGVFTLLGLLMMLVTLDPENKLQQYRISFILFPDKPSKDSFSEAIYKHNRAFLRFGKKSIVEFDRKKIRRAMRRFIENEDPTVVLAMPLTKENTYGDFVFIVNQCMIHQYKRYALMDDTFYVVSPNDHP